MTKKHSITLKLNKGEGAQQRVIDLQKRPELMPEDTRVSLSHEQVRPDVRGLPTANTRNPNHIRKGEYQVLPKRAVNRINRIIDMLETDVGPQRTAKQIGATLANALAEGMDFIDVCSIFHDEGLMPTVHDLDAIAELEDQADIKAAARHEALIVDASGRAVKAKKAKCVRCKVSGKLTQKGTKS